jgi:single-stranded-DNA-specific exonuclease
LLRRQRVAQRYLTEDDIGFTIGPRLNAASRMDAPEDAFLLLSTTDEAAAAAAAAHLDRLNNERKGVVAAMVKEAHAALRQHPTVPPIIVIGNPLWRPALVGLVAGKLADEHQRPAFVWGRDGNQVLKGSARGAGGVSVVSLMTACADVFAEYGGHHVSGGFTVRDEAVHELLPRLLAAYEHGEVTRAVVEPPTVDAELSLSELTPALVRAVMALAPFGMGNPKPRFAFKEVVPRSIETFGKAGEHTRVRLQSGMGAIEGIAFFTTPEMVGFRSQTPAPTTIIAELEQSFFMGRHVTRLRLVQAIPCS